MTAANTRVRNAGQTESVRGALHIQLGGDASYFGKIVKKAAFGDPMRLRRPHGYSRSGRSDDGGKRAFAVVLCVRSDLRYKSEGGELRVKRTYTRVL